MGNKAGFDEDSLIDIREVRMDDEVSSPATPPTGQKTVFVKSGELKQLDSSAAERFVGDKITISANDTTSDYIENKLVASTGVTLTKVNPGANETYQWSVNNTVGSSRFAIICGAVGNTSNKYLEFFRSNPSSTSPFVIAESCEIASIAASSNGAATCTFSIKKNGVQVDTITLTAQDSNTKSSLSISLVAGDKISVNMTSGSATDPQVMVFIKVLL